MPHHTLLISLLSLSILLSGCNAAAPSAQILATTQQMVVTPVVQVATDSPSPSNADTPGATLAPTLMTTRSLLPQATASLLLPEITLKKGNF